MSKLIDTANYKEQLAEKAVLFQQQLLDLKVPLPEMEVFTSPESHYRLRAEFKIWHQGDQAHYAMTDSETKKPILIDEFPVASLEINRLMAPLLEAINQQSALRKKLFQLEFLSTLTGDTLITLIYHRPLNEEWTEAATALKSKLAVNIIGRSRKQKLILDRDFVNETLSVAGRQYHYKQIEGSFTQPNGAVCEKMLSWVVQYSQCSEGDLLELYCGNGNFTLPLASNFRKVLATEISKASIAAAQENRHSNGLDNATFVRMSSEEFTQAMDGIRTFRRLREIDLNDYEFTTVFVDPPRAGLDDVTLEMIQRFDQIIYISCNPATLLNNLEVLVPYYRVTALAVFDQFPYTHHLETGVILRKV